MRIHVYAGGPGEILKHRVRASVSFRPGGEVQTAGPVAEPTVFRGQNRILAGIGAQRGGGNLGQAVLGLDVLGVQMPAQAEGNPVSAEQLLKALRPLNDIAAAENAVLKDILVTRDENKAALLAGFLQLS